MSREDTVLNLELDFGLQVSEVRFTSRDCHQLGLPFSTHSGL